MAIPNNVSKVVFSGYLGGGERFAIGFWLNGNAPVNQDAANLLASTLATSWGTDLKVKLCGLLSTDSGYDTVTVYGYPTGGPKAATIGQAALSGGVGTGANTQYDQVAACATLLTGAPGRSNRGRMYVPLNGKIPASTSAGPQIDATSYGNVSTGLATFFKNWATNHGSAMGYPAVVSITASVARNITAVKCDSRADIQRRRANRQTISGSTTTAAV